MGSGDTLSPVSLGGHVSLSNAAETALLALMFTNVSYTNFGDAGGLLKSTSDGTFTLCGHTADPGEGGDQTTNEISYTGYSPPTVARTAAAWTVTGNLVENDAEITFGACTAGSGSLAYVTIGTGFSEAIVFICLVNSGTPLSVSAGVEPKIAIADLDITID